MFCSLRAFIPFAVIELECDSMYIVDSCARVFVYMYMYMGTGVCVGVGDRREDCIH